MASTGSELYTAGRLFEAIDAVSGEVKRHPTDGNRRGFLAELLCLAGNLERADLQLDAIGKQDPQATPGIALFRQLIRAEQARQQFYTEGRLPEFLDTPSPQLRAYLEASVLLRDGRGTDAARLLLEAEETRRHVSGTSNGEQFDDLRDLDDLTACVFEVLTSNGKYYWIPIEQVASIEFHPPERPRDLLWRRASMDVRGGPDGEVFLPAIYAGLKEDADEQMRLARATDWTGGDGTPVRGIGQRTFLVGDEARPILELGELVIHAPH